jgi:hypothetical protein
VTLFTRHPTLLQTAYSEVKRRAIERSAWLVGTPGSVGTRSVGGRGGAVLVGPHAHGALMNELGIRGPAFRTQDVDIGRGSPLRVDLGPDESP